MFWDFLARSSGGGANPRGLASELTAGRLSPRLSMLSSRASCSARWSSTRPPPPRSPNRLDGISTCEAILAVQERFPSRVTVRGRVRSSQTPRSVMEHTCDRRAARRWTEKPAGERTRSAGTGWGEAGRGAGRLQRGRDASQLPPALPTSDFCSAYTSRLDCRRQVIITRPNMFFFELNTYCDYWR